MTKVTGQEEIGAHPMQRKRNCVARVIQHEKKCLCPQRGKQNPNVKHNHRKLLTYSKVPSNRAANLLYCFLENFLSKQFLQTFLPT